MSMKVFISHQRDDGSLALRLKNELTNLGVSGYLDLLDSFINGNGKELTDHIKSKLNECSALTK